MSKEIFYEIIKLGSKAAVETNTAKLTKFSIAIGILNSAIAFSEKDPSNVKRLTTLARSIANSSVGE